MIEKKRGCGFVTGIEIVLLICGTFAFAYLLREGMQYETVLDREAHRKIPLIFGIFKMLRSWVFSEKTLVSALEGSDLQKGVATCTEGKDGSICQEYIASECEAKCAGSCFPTRRDQVTECKLGTCLDPDSGVCQERASRAVCEKGGGIWFDDPAGNIAECKKACCVIGNEVRPLVTARECKNIGETSGIETVYRPEIQHEIACLALAHSDSEGGCVFDTTGERRCKFITKKECTEGRGEFYEGALCTHPDLKMNYEKQATAKCVEEKDELYWFDSEGNRENVYDANKVRSWNGGNILSPSKSCEVGNGLENQKTCGNCNRLLGSVCGEKTTQEKLSDNSINAVCRDSRCVDKKGNVRQNGEMWCEYQGAIGIEKGSGGLNRSVETPGSRHFIARCVDGDVEVDPCADYRNEICTEEKANRGDGIEVSTAACITNLWQLCLSYNSEVKGSTKAEKAASLEARNNKCLKNPHCMLKNVNIDSTFKFDLCTPKYAPGFDLKKNAEGGELSCAFANQKCTVIYVKELSGWECKANCHCRDAKFTEQMNDLCMSLGDCGASVNYAGDLTLNYNMKNSKKLSTTYLNEIKKYAEPIEGKYAQTNVTAYINTVGGFEKFGGKAKGPECNLPFGCELLFDTEVLNKAGTITGATGTVASITGYLLPSVAGIATVLAAATIGFAITSLLIKYTGIEGGLDPAVTWTLISAGTIGAGILGVVATGVGSVGAGTGFTLIYNALLAGIFLVWAAVILIVLVLITIVVFKAIGIGDTKKKVVTFQCQPWQPPLGGAKCEECGKDGYSCSPYACQALGQTCELINLGTEEEKCVDISPDDVTAPVIKPWEEVLTKGYRYEENSGGVKIIADANDGCLPAYTNVIFGIRLNELGYCRYTTQHTNNFEGMDGEEDGFDFGDRNLYRHNHSQLFTMPDLTSLGVPGYDPNRRADFNLYVRCRDGNGNGEQAQEYAVNFCVKPGEDITPPVITGREPYSEFVKFDAQELDAAVFVNEPAECKWSLDSGKKFDEMENAMTCETDVVDREALAGWKCESTFDLSKNQSSFLIQCKDQPWHAGANESKRNTLTTPYEFKVGRTQTPLTIVSIMPSNESFVFGVEPATVTLEVKTTGGVDNGKATCTLFGRELGLTFGDTHRQVFNQIVSGSYAFPIICEDAVGNSVENVSRFVAELDTLPPVVTRVYDRSGTLIVITNENAECAFLKGDGKKDECGFAFEKGTRMEGNEKVHSTLFDGNVYSITCRDRWKNTPGACNVVVGKGGVYDKT